MEEIWKDIKDFEGIYQVSNFGSVRSLTRMRVSRSGSLAPVKGRVLKLKVSKSGYLVVHLRNCDFQKHPAVHRLVAEAFISNPEGKPTVNHIDGVKTNNNISNLEWATHSEQMKHAFENDLATKRGEPKFSPEFKLEVFTFFQENDISIADLARKFNLTERTAGRLSKGEIFRNNLKIPQEEIENILRMRDEGMTLQAIASKYGCGTSQIHRITRKESRVVVYER